MSAAAIIENAIREMRLLAFHYHGGLRLIEPHTFGLDRWDEELLCGYQLEGISRSGNPAGWKFFRVAEMSQLRAENRHFSTPRPEYRRGDGAFRRIIAEL